MIGLVYKDLLCLRKSAVSYVVGVLIYFILTAVDVLDMSIFAGILAMMVSLLPFSSFSFDHAAKWDCYGLALPVSRTKTVAARYVTVLLTTAAALALTLLGGGAMAMLGRLIEWEVYLMTVAVCMGLSVMVNVLLLPILYWFGAERARIAFMGVLGGVILAAFVVLQLLGGLAWLESWPDPAPAFAAAMPFAVVGVGAALLAVSYLVSCRIYAKKEM